MHDVRTPLDVLARRLSALERHLPGIAAGDVEAVHQVRVASRRLREAVPVVAAGVKGVGRPAVERRLRKATRSLGPLRELDVALTMTAELAARSPANRAVLSALSGRLRDKREQARTRALDALSDARTRKLVRRARALVAHLEGERPSAWRAVLSVRLERRGHALRQAVEAAGALYATETLHAVRVATKKLRYGVELAHETASAAVASSLKRLKEMQDLLGRLHDLDILTAHLRDLAIDAGEGTASEAALQAILADLTRESRLLHARYLRRRDVMLRLADQTAERLAPALRVERGRPLRATSAARLRAASGA